MEKQPAFRGFPSGSDLYSWRVCFSSVQFSRSVIIVFLLHCCCCCCQVASVVSDSVRPRRRQSTRLPRPWNSPGKNTGVGALLKAKDGETAIFQGISFGKWSVLLKSLFQFSSVQFSRSVVSDSLRPHGLQHARPPCPSPTPRVYPNSCPSSRWCHPAISSSVSPFSCLPSCPGSGSFPVGLFQAQYKSAAATSPVCPQLTPWLSPAHLQLSDQATLPWSHTSLSISFTAVTTAGSCGAFRICWPLPLSELSPLFILSFPGGSDNKPSACNVGDLGSIPWWGRFPGEGNGNQFLPGESHGQRSLVGYRPRGRTESDMTEWLHFHFLFFMLESPAPEVANQLHFKEKLFWVAWCNGGKSLQTVRRWDSKQQRLLHYWPGRRSLPCQEGRQGPIPQNSGFCAADRLGRRRGLQGARPCKRLDSSPLGICAQARTPDYRAVKQWITPCVIICYRGNRNVFIKEACKTKPSCSLTGEKESKTTNYHP